MEVFSLRTKSRVGSFGSDDSFDVVSIDGSVGDCVEIEVEQDASESGQDDGEVDDDWEDVAPAEPGESQVDINLDESFKVTIEAALDSCITEAPEPAGMPTPLPSPRRSAREALRAFYLARAKSSEESSKLFRTYVPQPPAPPAVIAPQRAPQRYDVELYERITREENERKAKTALREFYAQREAAKAVRAAENRANERFVYKSQIGSSHFLGMPHGVPSVEPDGSSTFSQSLWETTRFVSAA